jgi:DNA helicase-2/ATP-dependent DNA helicase PcrA
MVVLAGMEEGLFPHARAADDDADLEEERRLCYVGITRAQRRLILTGAARRRVFGEYHSSEPSRFIDEIPPALVEEVRSTSSYQTAALSRRSMPMRPVRRAPAATEYRPEDEDQSALWGLSAGVRVRHPQFGIGTVLSVEPLDDDVKLVVRFLSVGSKTLRARYAKLEVA